jgi:NAD(P)-dependent dehydrogenase (short-subunit alcohol dehydrogenase family)
MVVALGQILYLSRGNRRFTYELARRLAEQSHVTVNALHPGVVRTELGRYMVDDSNRWYMVRCEACGLHKGHMD